MTCINWFPAFKSNLACVMLSNMSEAQNCIYNIWLVTIIEPITSVHQLGCRLTTGSQLVIIASTTPMTSNTKQWRGNWHFVLYVISSDKMDVSSFSTLNMNWLIRSSWLSIWSNLIFILHFNSQWQPSHRSSLTHDFLLKLHMLQTLLWVLIVWYML